MVQLAGHFLTDAPPVHVPVVEEDVARRALRGQIARLERQLADALVTGFPVAAVEVAVPGRDGPRLLGLGDLEALRDDLAARLRTARQVLAERAERQEQARLLLESMHANPRAHVWSACRAPSSGSRAAAPTRCGRGWGSSAC